MSQSILKMLLNGSTRVLKFELERFGAAAKTSWRAKLLKGFGLAFAAAVSFLSLMTLPSYKLVTQSADSHCP
jgi:hypothetical protein